MELPSEIIVVGAGGIACQLVPCLSRVSDIYLYDGDDYEPKNSSRQFPALLSTENKAKVLAAITQAYTQTTIHPIPRYFKGVDEYGDSSIKDAGMIIGVVDNNDSRHRIYEFADVAGIPAIVAGNEEEMGEAHLFVPGLYNPLEHFEFEKNTTDSPFSCNSNETLESAPQTIWANALAFGAISHILTSWIRCSNPENCIAHSRAEAFSSSFSRIKNMIQKQDTVCITT